MSAVMGPVMRGQFDWPRKERESDRYGAFFVTGGAVNAPALARLETRRVRITCRVDQTRKSPHPGDLFHEIYPSTPEVGEVIDLGVGLLQIGSDCDGNVLVMLVPGDRRNWFWLDPRKLYRLHSQTVSVFIEETRDDFSPPAPRKNAPHGFVAMRVPKGDT